MDETTIRSGDRVIVRPIRADDKKRMLESFARLSPQSRYRRFFAATPHLQDGQLRYLTEIDHHDHEALVAIDPESDQGVGVARFIRSKDEPTVAEVAVAVVDDWQGRGLGTALLHDLAARGREAGVECFSASVLMENGPALELMRGLGEVHVGDREHGVTELLIELPAEGGLSEPVRHCVRAAARGELERAGSLV